MHFLFEKVVYKVTTVFKSNFNNAMRQLHVLSIVTLLTTLFKTKNRDPAFNAQKSSDKLTTSVHCSKISMYMGANEFKAVKMHW